jgi:predicted CXXCH cytochrome family protein
MKAFFRPICLALLVLSFLALGMAGQARAEESACNACHEQLTVNKSVHPAMAMGCATCHGGVDASDMPHKITNRNPKGLVAKMKDLCFNCHDRAPFQKATVHGALILGCTTCHNPHSTDHAHILKEEIPRLCLNCHEERLAALKSAPHPIAGNEACSSCHHPHATDAPKLVRTQPERTPKGETAMNKKPAVAHQ